MKKIYLTENQLSLLNESYGLRHIDSDDILKIRYSVCLDEDNEEMYSLEVYDYSENLIFEDKYFIESEIYEIFDDDIADQIVNKEGKYDERNNVYVIENDIVISNPYDVDEVNEVAKKIFKDNYIDEYYPMMHGYILTDGTCLDFRYELDHESIQAIPTIEDKFDFVALGNIRCGNSSFDIIKYPTDEQWEALRVLINNSKDLSVDIYAENKNMPLTSALYDGVPDFHLVMGEIDRFFDEGIKLKGGYSNYDDYYMNESEKKNINERIL